jgi:hypothetical protein
MHEIDLVPDDYRQSLGLRRALTQFIAVFFCLVMIVAGGRLWLGQLMRSEKRMVEELGVSESTLLNKQKIIADLREQKRGLTERLAVLDMLRGGPQAVRLFEVVDRSINPSIWFDDWKFVREAKKTEKKPHGQLKAGYFIVIPAEKKQVSGSEVWRKNMHMDISGQALNHASLADFVRKLLAQPEIDDVKVISTVTRQYQGAEVINYDLVVRVHPKRKKL